jgi:AbiV family abortive infection protein
MTQRGDLTEAQIHDLMAACTANATDLLDEARLLFGHKYFPRAYVLAQLSAEEFTKALLLLSLLLMRAGGLNPPMELFWSWWVDHDEKGSFQKSWADMIANFNSSNWMQLSVEPVKALIYGSIGGLAESWPSAQAHARATSTWREDATYVDFRNSAVLVPKGRVGRGRAKTKIDQAATFGELITEASAAPPNVAALQEGEVPGFVREVIEFLIAAQSVRVPGDPTKGSASDTDMPH